MTQSRFAYREQRSEHVSAAGSPSPPTAQGTGSVHAARIHMVAGTRGRAPQCSVMGHGDRRGEMSSTLITGKK